MSPWLFKVWRLAWARSSFSSVGGWRRLWWRLWWDLRIQAPMPKIRIIPPLLIPKILHWPTRTWLHGARPLKHWCDASFSEPWCEAYEDVTCPQCKRLGSLYYLQYKMNTR